MQRALELATYAIKNCRPNPAVGAVIVKNGKIIGKGYTQGIGKDHAEISAIKNASADLSKNAERQPLKNAELYVTLEPCSHFGRTPPCVNAIIESGIKKVYYGFLDPNPQVAGKGIVKLNEAGVETILSTAEGKTAAFYEPYSWFVKRKTPLVTVKISQTLDGFIANSDKTPVQITGEESQIALHELRSWCDAVVVGGGTFRADNPALTVRKVKGANPQKVIFSRSSGMFSRFSKNGSSEAQSFSSNWFSMLNYFAEQGMHSVLVESGAAMAKNLFSIAAQNITQNENFPHIFPFHKFLLWTSPKRLEIGLPWNSEINPTADINLALEKTYMQGCDFCQEYNLRARIKFYGGS